MRSIRTASSTATAGKNLVKTVFSGIQPTGIPHLGNYAGAIRQWIELQRTEPSETKLLYSVVDLHALTTPKPAEELKRLRRESMATLLALGIDPDRATLFWQSSVPAHSELMWILSCTASVGYLSRMTQWKSKLNLADSSSLDDKEVRASLKLGLLSYPVLQAADILVHRATHVPVGADQHQHLEYARECVTNFNTVYGNHLVYPQTMSTAFHRIQALHDPGKKMSKSHLSEKSRILVTDTPETIKRRISQAKTDSLPGISYDPAERPGISNLADIYSLFDPEGRTGEELAAKCKDLSPKQFKDEVAEIVIQGLDGVRYRYLGLLKDPERIDMIGSEGSRKARNSAAETMAIVRAAIGL